MRKSAYFVSTTLCVALVVSACAAGSDSAQDSTTTTSVDSAVVTPTTASATANTEGTSTDSTIVLNIPKTKPLTGTYDSVFTPGDIDKGLAPFITIAVNDLMDRLGVDESEIAVVTATVVVWSDAGLGCPEPDMFYAQVPTDGSLVELSVDGVMYRYHSGGQRQPFLCEQPLKEAPATTDIDL